MVAYSFKRRFVVPIARGLGVSYPIDFIKRQTIRAHRRRHARPGEEVQLYHGMRTKGCFLIGRAWCTSVAGIRLQLGRGIVSMDDYPAIRDGDLDAFAQADGFADWIDMRKFWEEEHGELEFDGVIIKWKPLTMGLRSAA